MHCGFVPLPLDNVSLAGKIYNDVSFCVLPVMSEDDDFEDDDEFDEEFDDDDGEE